MLSSNFLPPEAKISKRDDVKAIFDPLITDIERLVDDQVNLVKVKRMQESHPKANEIKVNFSSSDIYGDCLMVIRQSFLSEDLERANI